MNYFLYICEVLEKFLNQKLTNEKLTKEKILSLLEVPKEPEHGDMAFPCFTLAKLLRQAPPLIAQQLADAINSESLPELEQVKAVGPYLNFFIDKSHLAQNLVEEILKGSYLDKQKPKNQKIMVEYSQPNTHKAFHVGHIRNVALGDSLSRICSWAGYEVFPVNYFGDVGTHVAKCIWYYRNYFNGQVPDARRGEFLGEIYTKASDMMDFSLLTQVPILGVVTAKVEKIKPHPNSESLKVVELKVGSASKKTVVCGGEGFNEGDTVAYAPVGVRFSGREVTEVDKGGVLSQGFICSQKELGLGPDKDKIYTFSTQVSEQVSEGELVAEVFRIKGALPSDVSVAEEITKRQTGVQEVLKALESNEPEVTSLWHKTRQWSLDEFKEIYKWLGAEFVHDFYESDVGDLGKKLVQQYLKKGVFVKSEGAIGVDLSDDKLPFFLVLKSDGSGLYSTKDLALAQMKFDRFGIDKSVYVVDSSQSLHFQQVFKTLQRMGYKKAQDCYHLSYGMVERADGKMSSRKGNVILFSQLKELLLNKIKTEFLNKYESQWPAKQIEDVAHKIAVGTIRYGMLNQDNNKNIIFDLNEWTSQTGNTGPYMMYAYARIQSILRDLGDRDLGGRDFSKVDWSVLNHKTEHLILRRLMFFQDTVLKSAHRYEPQLLCIYLYDLCKDFSRMYSQCSVLKADSEVLKHTRGALIDGIGQVLKKGLELLGITTAERM